MVPYSHARGDLTAPICNTLTLVLKYVAFGLVLLAPVFFWALPVAVMRGLTH